MQFFYTRIYIQFPITAIREIKILKGLDHKNIVKLENMLVSKRMKLSLKCLWQQINRTRTVDQSTWFLSIWSMT